MKEFLHKLIGNVVSAQGGSNLPSNGGGGSNMPSGDSSSFSNPFGEVGNIDNITDLIEPLIDFLINAGTVVVVFFIIFSGFKMVIAQGNSDKIKSAKSMFFWTIIGGLILLGSKVLLEVVQSTISSIG